MSPVSRMIMIVGLMAIVGLSALYFMAGQFQKAAMEGPRGEISTVAVALGRDSIIQFADVRQAIREWLAKHPDTLELIRNNSEGEGDPDQSGTLGLAMMKIQRVRSLALRETGLEEEKYRVIREQYRIYLQGEGELNPAFRDAFNAIPVDVMERADLGEFEALDY